MSKSFILIFLFFLFSNQAKSQAPRFIFSDSFATIGTCPIPPAIIKKNFVRKTLVYRSDSRTKDSFLLQSFLYDTAGYLIQSMLYSPKGEIISQDTLIYDQRHRLKELLARDKWANIFYKSTYTYRSSSVVEVMDLYNLKNEISSFSIRKYYNNQQQLIKVASVRLNTTEHYTNEYTYNKKGLPSKHFLNFKSTGQTEEHTYRYQQKRKKSIRSYWVKTAAGKTKQVACVYNLQNQCLSCTSFLPGKNPVSKVYTYYPNSLLFTQVEKKEKYTITTTFYHFTGL